MKLNQITLPSHNLSETIQFYKQLGCELIVDTPHYLRFKAPGNDVTFSFILSDVANPTTIYFELESEHALEQNVKQLIENGISFTSKPEAQRYLWHEATLVDPSGNHIKLYFAGDNRLNPPWKVAN